MLPFSDDSIRNFVDKADIILLLGAKLTDYSTSMFRHGFTDKQIISINVDQASVFGEKFTNHSFEPIIKALKNLNIPSYKGKYLEKKLIAAPFIPEDKTLIHKTFWRAIQNFVQENDTIVSEMGTSFYGTFPMQLKENNKFIGQSFWRSTGFSLPAAFGSQIANPKSRHLLL